MGNTSSDLLREFYYVDYQMVEMFFTQLPKKARERFHNEYGMIVQPKFKASVLPSVESSRDKLGAPYDSTIAQLRYVEEYIRANETLGDVEKLQGRFIEGTVVVRYASVTTPTGSNLLFAFPKEVIYERKEQFMKSYTILGDIDKCWYSSGSPPEKTPDDSTLSRIVSVWDNILIEKSRPDKGVIRPALYTEFTDRRQGVLRALQYMEQHLENFALERTFSGIMKVRERFTGETHEHVVLYPLYLEIPPVVA